MFKNKFFESTSDRTNITCQRLSKIPSVYNRLVRALRKLGDFDYTTQMHYHENTGDSYVIDKAGTIFYFNSGLGIGNSSKYQIAKKINEKKYEIYSFATSELEKDSDCYLLADGKVSIKKMDHIAQNAHVIQYTKNDHTITHHVFFYPSDTTRQITEDEINQFVVDYETMQDNSFMQFVSSFYSTIGAKDSKFSIANFSSTWNNQETGNIKLTDGVVKEFYVMNENSEEISFITLEDGEIKSQILKKIPLKLEESSLESQNQYKKALELFQKKN